MKKIILFTLLVSSLFAEATVYVGSGYANYSETLNSTGHTTSDNSATLKIGYGDRKAYAIEFSLEYIDMGSAALDFKSKYGFNISLLKSFDWDIYVLPYVKAGFGAGKRDSSTNPSVKTLSYGSYNFGMGMFLPLSEDWDVEVGYEYRNISYASDSSVSVNDGNYERSQVNIAYLGLNYRF